MNHPFEVGSWYENRAGDYQVIDLDKSHMTIRYEDGDEIETPIKLQRRILRNMALEEEIRKTRKERQRRKAKKRISSRRYGKEFDGLDDEDFKDSVAGTSWRARSGLGGLLAQKLSESSGRQFISYAVPRRTEVYVVQPHAYDRKNSVQKAKFWFGLDEHGADHGFLIEKKDGAMDEAWDWPYFVESLKTDTELQQSLAEAMAEADLEWRLSIIEQADDAVQQATAHQNGKGLVLQFDSGNETQSLTWEAFAGFLSDIETEYRCDLYLTRRLDKEKAQDLGTAIADRVANIWEPLVPVYAASVRR